MELTPAGRRISNEASRQSLQRSRVELRSLTATAKIPHL